jgi:putative PIN family toxin of toxin-antitoxin system
MKAVVLDTNVVVSGLYFPKSKPGQVLGLLRAGRIANFTSNHLLEEVERVLIRAFDWEPPRAQEAREWFEVISCRIQPTIRLSVLDYEPDNRVLECAVEAKASFIVTGDKKHLLKLGHFQDIEIIDPATFLMLFCM